MNTRPRWPARPAIYRDTPRSTKLSLPGTGRRPASSGMEKRSRRRRRREPRLHIDQRHVHWAKNVKPEYVFSTVRRTIISRRQTVDPSRPVQINSFAGHYDDPDAKIRPVKIHRAKQIYDRGNEHPDPAEVLRGASGRRRLLEGLRLGTGRRRRNEDGRLTVQRPIRFAGR